LHSKPYNNTHTHLDPFPKISYSKTSPKEVYSSLKEEVYSSLKAEVYSSLKEEVYSSLKEEVGLFIIRQFLSQSQDGATILLKTGGQVIKYFFKLKIKTFISKQKIR